MIKTTARWASRLGLVVAVVGTIGCDRVTKHLATSALAGMPSRSYLADTIWLGYTENSGGLLSVGAGLPQGVRTLIFTCGTALMLVALSVLAMRHRWRAGPRSVWHCSSPVASRTGSTASFVAVSSIF